MARTAIIPVIVILLVLFVAWPHAQPAAGFGDALQLLDAWVSDNVALRRQPGLSIGVVLGDRLVWDKSYGLADVERKVPATSRSVYPIASISKTFTSIAILQLRDAGKLRLDDPVDTHLKWARIKPIGEPGRIITIRELLTHSSGIQREVPGTIWTKLSFPSVDALREELTRPHDANTSWKYSNLAFALLGEVVAVTSGEPWDQYVRRHILEPLGMKATQAVASARGDARVIGYGRPRLAEEYKALPVIPSMGATSAAASMASNVEDMAKYVAFHLTASKPSILSAATLREMHRPHFVLEDWQNAWGLGVRIRRLDGHVRVSHAGSVPGVATFVEFIPTLRLGVIVLGNADDTNPMSYADYTLQLLSPIVAKATPPALRRAPANAERYTGRYRSAIGTFTTWVTMLNGELAVVRLDAPNPYAARMVLEPTGDRDRFILRRPPEVFSYDAAGEEVVFETNDAGRIIGYTTPIYRFVRDESTNR